MRTTIDLPSDLMQAAKVRAAQRGESLKDLFARAIAHEVRSPSRARTMGRLAFPLIGQDSDPRVEVTTAGIEAPGSGLTGNPMTCSCAVSPR